MNSLISPPDTDSGLSMPSGTLHSANSWRNPEVSSRISEQDHEKLIKSLLGKSINASSLNETNKALPAMTSTGHSIFSGADAFVVPLRSGSPIRSPSRMEKLSTMVPDNYFTSGLSGSLSFSNNGIDTGRNVLLDKLKEAQDTLRLQSVRLSKMESDYHATSYEVEELKCTESELMRKVSELEKEKEEYNKQRMKDIEVQIGQQDRIKNLEEALQAIAADYQLLENDHMRRKELVEQLSTTVELVDEENKKLHKVESTINADLQSLKQELCSGKEEKNVFEKQQENQKREIRYWREENEKSQSLIRQLQDTISELKVKVTSLTHKLENIDIKQHQLSKENEDLRLKERELLDSNTNFQSKVAILSSDKNRLYQEKTDYKCEAEKLNLQYKQSQEDLLTYQLAIKKYNHEKELKDQTLQQLTECNKLLEEELMASQKVGEKLSVELTKTKELADKLEEQTRQEKMLLHEKEETINNIQSKCNKLECQLKQSLKDYQNALQESAQTKALLDDNLETARRNLREKLSENEKLNDCISGLQKKLLTLEKTMSVQVDDFKAEANTWKERFESADASMQRKEDEVNMMSHKLADYKTQLTKALSEQETKQLDYENYKLLHEENQRLTMRNHRLTADKTETEQVVQLLQTQRDIYARSVQELTSKANQVDAINAENLQLHDQLKHLRNTFKLLEDELKSLKDSNRKLEKEISTAQQNHEINTRSIQSENIELKVSSDQLQQENASLKTHCEDKSRLELEVQDLRKRLEESLQDKTANISLSKQNVDMCSEVTQLKGVKSFLTNKVNQIEEELKRQKEEKAVLLREVGLLKQQINDRNNSLERLEQTREALSQSDGRNIQYQNQIEAYEKECDALNIQLKSATDALELKEKHCQKMEAELTISQQKATDLQEQINLLQSQVSTGDLAYSEKEVLAAKCKKLLDELNATQEQVLEMNLASKLLTNDLDVTKRGQLQLQQEVSCSQAKYGKLQKDSERQISTLTSKLADSENQNRDLQAKLEKNQKELDELTNLSRKLESQVVEKRESIEKLEAILSNVKSELHQSNMIQSKQDSLIDTLKDEVTVLRLCENELIGARRKIRVLQDKSEETGETVVSLKKKVQCKENHQKQLEEITSDLLSFKSELQQTYATVNHKNMEIERLQSQLSHANIDSESNEEKIAELKIRLDQMENAKIIASRTLQEKIQGIEAENHTYKNRILFLEKQLQDLNEHLSSKNAQLNLSQDESLMNKESNFSLTTVRDNLQAEYSNLQTQLTKLQTELTHTSSDKRTAQVQLKEAKMEIFKLEKEKENVERTNSRIESSLNESNKLLKSVTAEYEACGTKLFETEREVERLRKDKLYLEEAQRGSKNVYDAERERYQSEIRKLQHQLVELRSKLRDLEWKEAQTSIKSNVMENAPIVTMVDDVETDAASTEQSRSALTQASSLHLTDELETDAGSTELSRSVEDLTTNSSDQCSTDGSITRDQTMKIFMQLKKAKQRSKKCLAPPPKVTEPFDFEELKTRHDSFEDVQRDDGELEESDVEHLKENIMTKSDDAAEVGKVEWRGDPREATKKYLSSWDLSVITDVDETESMTDMHKSMPNLAAAGETGSSESLGSLMNFDLTATARDSPQLSSSMNSLHKTPNKQLVESMPSDGEVQIAFLAELSDGESSEVVTEESSPRSISTESSPKSLRKPQSPDDSSRSPGHLPKDRKLLDSSRIPRSSQPRVIVKKTTSANNLENPPTSKLPKLSLFKKTT